MGQSGSAVGGGAGDHRGPDRAFVEAVHPERAQASEGSTKVPRGARDELWLLLHRLHLDRDLDLVAHQYSSCLERLIPGEPEVAPVDLGIGAKADPLAAPGVLAGSLIDRVQRDLAGGAPDGQIAADPELVARLLGRALHPSAPERDRGVVLHVQEVGRAEVLVPLVRPGIDARGLDLGLDPRTIGIPLVDGDGAGYLAEPPLHRGDHHVLGRELDQRMVGVNLPGTDSGPGSMLLYCAHDPLPCEYQLRNSSPYRTNQGSRA